MLFLFASVFSATDRCWAAQHLSQRTTRVGAVAFHVLTLHFQGHEGRPRELQTC